MNGQGPPQGASRYVLAGPARHIAVQRVENGWVVYPPNWGGGMGMPDGAQVAESVPSLLKLVEAWAWAAEKEGARAAVPG